MTDKLCLDRAMKLKNNTDAFVHDWERCFAFLPQRMTHGKDKGWIWLRRYWRRRVVHFVPLHPAPSSIEDSRRVVMRVAYHKRKRLK